MTSEPNRRTSARGSCADFPRRHATFARSGQQWLLEDLGSTNGTLLNGQQMSRPHPVRPGDESRVGDTVLKVAEPRGLRDTGPRGTLGQQRRQDVYDATGRRGRAVRRWAQVVVTLLVGGVLHVGIAPSAVASVQFVVNSNGDQADLFPGDGVCQTALLTCTLRAAIQEANTTSARDSISFDIAGTHQIGLAEELSVDQPLVIDGTTEPDYAGTPVIEITEDSSFVSGASVGLAVNAPDSIVRGLSITGFGDGLEILGARAIVAGNYIGLDPDSEPKSNSTGVFVDAAEDVVIGGPSASQRNVISGNFFEGISALGSSRLAIENNYVGLDPSGASGIGNDLGISLWNSSGDIRDNVTSGNFFLGMEISDSSSVRITGNLVGTDASGTQSVENGFRGINIVSGNDHLIGGPTPEDRNIVSGNGDDGIGLIFGPDNVTVQGNYVGISPTGEPLGNGDDGLWCHRCTNTRFIDNVSSDNGDEGFHIRAAQDLEAANVVQGNLIGTDPQGVADPDFGNAEIGIEIEGSSANVIGGTSPEQANTIASSGQKGIALRNWEPFFGDPVIARKNALLGNRMIGNTEPGIDLGADGPTPNDAGDSDDGPNGLQNHPVLESVTTHGKTTKIVGALDSAPNQTYRIEIYSTSSCNGGLGEGENLFLILNVTTDGAGAAEIDELISGSPTGAFVLGTATDPASNTSEFSPCVGMNSPGQSGGRGGNGGGPASGSVTGGESGGRAAPAPGDDE